MAAKTNTKTATSNGRSPAQDLLDRYVEHVAKWFETTSATRAQHRKSINQLQLDLRMYHNMRGGTADQVAAGERQYVAFVEPAKSSVKTTFDMTEQELRGHIATLREIVADETETEKMRADADDRLGKFCEQAEVRGIDPDAEPAEPIAA